MLPLLGAVLLQKREIRGPLRRHWRVTYLRLPGKPGLGESWELQCPVRTETSPSPGF